jgi:PAS domain S-box-containing protein
MQALGGGSHLTPEVVAVIPSDPQTGHQCLWREVCDANLGFLMLSNSDHVCVHVSPAGLVIMGSRWEEVVGRRLDDLLEPDQMSFVWRARAAVAAGSRDVPARVRVRCGDGQTRWLDTLSSAVHDPVTGDVFTAIYARDATHEIELQAALTRSEQRHSALLAAVEHSVIQLDGALRIESFNQPTLNLLGHSPDQLLGRPAFTAVDLRDEDGRAVTDVSHPAVRVSSRPSFCSLAVKDSQGAWCTVGRSDGERRLVRVRLSVFMGSRPEDSGHLMVLFESGTKAEGTPDAPTREQARGAAGLTAREGDVLDGLAAGGDVPTIARWLGISVHSVRGHVKSITAKLGVHSQLQAVIVAARRGMVDLSEESGAAPPRTR